MSRPDTADDLARMLAHLQARVDALDAWRAHQSDLLDEHLNNHPDSDELRPHSNQLRSESDEFSFQHQRHGLDR